MPEQAVIEPGRNERHLFMSFVVFRSALGLRRFVACLIIAALLGGCGTSAPTDSVRIGTSSVGSTFYAIAVAMSELAYRHAQLNSTVQPVGGSVPNLFALDTNRLDLALVNAYAAYLAYSGLEPFEHAADIRLVLQGQRTYRHILVRRGSGIESPADFAGKTIVADRPSNPDMIQIMRALLAVYAIPEDQVQLISTSTSSEVMQAFQVGSIDAAMFPFGEGAAIVEEALNSGLIELLQISADTRDAALERLPPAVAGRIIPAGTFSGQTEDVNTFTLNAYLLARTSVDPQIVTAIVANVFDHRDEFVEYQGAAREWTLERTLEQAPIPYHEGTISYLQSAGLWSDALESRQRASLENSTIRTQ
jgi:TRAP transporter TAXI family solute receptor